MGRVSEQRAQGDVTGRDHKISNIKLKQGHLQHFAISKEVPTRHHYRETSHTISKNSMSWGASFKCLYTNACSTGNNHDAFPGGKRGLKKAGSDSRITSSKLKVQARTGNVEGIETLSSQG